MRIVQLIPGTGNFYCGQCLRDHALARALRAQGHEVVLAPMYLPLVLESDPDGDSEPLFFGGINVYLQQKLALFGRTPRWLDRCLDARWLLRWAANRMGMTRASDLGDMTVSMLSGESGRQVKELNRLTAWLADKPRPDAICLSTGLLAGLAGPLKLHVGAPVVCSLQGEDAFLDTLPDSHRDLAWSMLAERASDVDAFVAVSRYYGDLMSKRLNLPAQKLRVIHNGIELDELEPATAPPQRPALGFLARMCAGKGLKTLVEAFILLRQRPSTLNLTLRIAGAATREDEPFLNLLRQQLQAAGLLAEVEFLANIDRSQKASFLRSLSVLSTPATYGEAFGLYVLEALACGVPVVQPRHGAFPEVLAITGGGVLCAPDSAAALADAIESVLNDEPRARSEAARARTVVLERFSAARMARDVAELCTDLAC